MSAATATRRPRHVPQRTCVSCRSTTSKRELVRLVRTPEGRIEPDPTGKRPGRGAYLCRSAECWQAALRKDRLESALRTRLTAESRQTLLDYSQQLAAEAAT